MASEGSPEVLLDFWWLDSVTNVWNLPWSCDSKPSSCGVFVWSHKIHWIHPNIAMFSEILLWRCVSIVSFFFMDVDLYQPRLIMLTLDPQVDLMFFQDVPGEAIARHALQRTGDFFGQGEPINECLGISGRDFESRWCCIGVGFQDFLGCFLNPYLGKWSTGTNMFFSSGLKHDEKAKWFLSDCFKQWSGSMLFLKFRIHPDPSFHGGVIPSWIPH